MTDLPTSRPSLNPQPSRPRRGAAALNFGLATRLTASYLAILALVLAGLSLFLYVALARALEEHAFSLLRREAGDVRLFLAPFVVQGIPLAKAVEAVEVAKAPGVGVVLLERDGIVAAKARAAARVPLPDPSPDAI